MQFLELKEQVKSIGFDELRQEQDNYFEAVVVKDKIKELMDQMRGFFGAPTWPSQGKLSLEIEDQIRDYGGITEGQTLYFLERQEGNIFAMLWPWADGEHTTVKIIRR